MLSIFGIHDTRVATIEFRADSRSAPPLSLLCQLNCAVFDAREWLLSPWSHERTEGIGSPYRLTNVVTDFFSVCCQTVAGPAWASFSFAT